MATYRGYVTRDYQCCIAVICPHTLMVPHVWLKMASYFLPKQLYKKQITLDYMVSVPYPKADWPLF